MKIKWDHFDTFFAKLVATLIIIGGVWWMGFAIRYHYQTKATDWEYLPFIAGGLAVMFSLAILSRKATAGAAGIILPFVEQLRLGRETTSSVVVPAQPAKPATIVTTTTTPLPVPLPADKGEQGS